MKRGRLIVIEGTDGSGKSTQFARLCRRAEHEGIAFQRLVFPQYQEESSALLRMYLNGEFGRKPGDVNAYAASSFYAVDRYASWKQVWQGYYEAGGLVLADRYTTSNAVHQSSKVPPEERPAFFQWLFDFEYGRLGLPEPDLVLYLDMPIEVSQKLLLERYHGDSGKKDIHESHLDFLRACRESARYAGQRLGWREIPCAKDGEPLPVEEIHQAVLAAVSPLL